MATAARPVASRSSDPEQQLRDALVTGALVDLSTREEGADDPASVEAWGPERTIRAEVLAEVLTTPPDPDGGGRRRPLRLVGARITGDLDLEAAEIAYPVYLFDCWFDEPVMLMEASALSIRLLGCHLPGLNADRLTTRGNLELDEGFTATGGVSLQGAHIGGQLDLTDTTLINPDGPALNADGLTVDQDMLCHRSFHGSFSATGEVRLLGAHIGGRLTFAGATLINPDGIALNAGGLTVGQNMSCSDGFTATGETRLINARIGGLLIFDGARLSNADSMVLNANRLTVSQGMFCRGSFTATGETSLMWAHIGGSLDLTDATLANPDGCALKADGLTVDQNMFCRDSFTATSELRLLGAHVNGQLDLTGATLTNPDGTALDLESAQLQWLLLRPAISPEGLVDLTHAHVGRLSDDPATWPKLLTLHGFTYDTLAEPQPISVQQRLDWLARDRFGYAPQPYEQLSAVYRQAGREEDARRVAIAKQRRRRTSGELGWPTRMWNLLLGGLVGHGYRTWYAGLWLLAWVLAGSLVFAAAHPDHVQQVKPGERAPEFQPVVYALDTLLPVVNLQQEAAWLVQGWARWWAWASILVGWVLTTAVVATMTGILKRD